MDSEAKILAALIILVGVTPVALALSCVSQRLRDIALFVMIAGAVVMTRADVMFAGEHWYRGTSRGIQLSLIDLAPLCLLVATLLRPRYPRGRFYWPASLGLVLLFILYCVGSVVISDPKLYGIWELSKFVRGLMFFMAAALFVRTRRELAIVVFALCCTTCLEGLNSVEQRLFKGEMRPPGTLFHANTLSTYLCMVAPILVASAMSSWHKWLRIFAGVSWLTAAGAELLTLSRLGIPVFTLVSVGTAVACTSWRPTKEKVTVTLAALATFAGLLYVLWPDLKARYMAGDVKAELTDEDTVETRGVYWRLAMAMAEDHPFGVGLNNWSFHVGRTYGKSLKHPYIDYKDINWIPTQEDANKMQLAPAADSLPSLMIGELGFVGLGLFLIVWLRWFQMGAVFLGNRLNSDPMHRTTIGILFGVGGVLMQSATEWTFRQPGVFFTCNALVGVLASLYRVRKHAKREERRAIKEERRQREEEEIAASVRPIRQVAPLPVEQPALEGERPTHRLNA